MDLIEILLTIIIICSIFLLYNLNKLYKKEESNKILNKNEMCIIKNNKILNSIQSNNTKPVIENILTGEIIESIDKIDNVNNENIIEGFENKLSDTSIESSIQPVLTELKNKTKYMNNKLNNRYNNIYTAKHLQIDRYNEQELNDLQMNNIIDNVELESNNDNSYMIEESRKRIIQPSHDIDSNIYNKSNRLQKLYKDSKTITARRNKNTLINDYKHELNYYEKQKTPWWYSTTD